MPTRTAVPLHKKRQSMLVDAVQEHDDPHRSMIVHLALGIGARNDTICHAHSDWFFYSQGRLYIQIPSSEECRKKTKYDACGACRQAGLDHYQPKTPAGRGRTILISNEWKNHNIEGQSYKSEYFGLRDRVESYFGLECPEADSAHRYGHKMINGDGISRGTANKWLRIIAAESAIKSPFRRSRLEKEIEFENDEDDQTMEDVINKKLADHGTDEDGNQIPDIFMHDLRASFCTQLMRNEVPPNKAITFTGHNDPESMKPYVMFAQNELNAEEQEEWF